MFCRHHSSTLAAVTTVALLLLSATGFATELDDLLLQYQQQGAGKPQPASGEELWQTTFTSDGNPTSRGCTSCHGRDLRTRGKHVKTNKTIDPLAPSVNAERLMDAKKIEKWFKRNCKWTLGRECSAQEKADFLGYIRNQ